VRIGHELQLTTASIRYRMKKGGEITGFEEVTKPYVLRDGAVKAFNQSRKYPFPPLPLSIFPLTRTLRQRISAIPSRTWSCSIPALIPSSNITLIGILTFDVQSIYRGLERQKALMRFACSMSQSIDPRRPWKLTTAQLRSVNDYFCIVKLQRRVNYLYGARKGSRRWEKYQKALKRFRSEKQRQRGLFFREIKERYKREQPVIDSERQLSGKVVDEEVLGALERSDYITPEQLNLIDAVLTLPETSIEKEC
jgi:hypothetical protein